jgi:transcriptional regulator with XRE-family HTH domain
MKHKMIYSEAYTALIAKLRKARINADVTQLQIARQIGTSRSWIARVERGQIRLDLLHLVYFTKALGLSASKLVQEMEDSIKAE